MVFNGFKLHATPTIHEAYCTNPKCKKKPELTEVSNGFLSIALFCHVCKSVYLLKLERQARVPKKFIQQCEDEIERDYRRSTAAMYFNNEIKERDDLAKEKELKKAKKYIKKTKQNGKS